ncbi:DUF6954 family protein [Paenibacillus spongiae]|uniref:Uncharacterized protein n=1 Tax=Paenibacillus spongiae TaxID=2909671 RepID=A0ABY5SMA6_9BACL|nr:hypothetical protein [Paenibacillus spongiae]UVI33358.1 hypothetical protein L1F29_16610 [Paenibacillus spongiae]
MKVVLGFVMFVLYALVTMFGLGPVLFADGTDQERMFTLAVVIAIYVALTIITYLIFRKKK